MNCLWINYFNQYDYVMHAVYCKFTLYFDRKSQVVTFILKFGGDLIINDLTWLGAAKSTKSTSRRRLPGLLSGNNRSILYYDNTIDCQHHHHVNLRVEWTIDSIYSVTHCAFFKRLSSRGRSVGLHTGCRPGWRPVTMWLARVLVTGIFGNTVNY